VLLRELRERDYKGGYTILTDLPRRQRTKPCRRLCDGLRPRRASRCKWIEVIWAACRQ
jgi:hypothetical protein